MRQYRRHDDVVDELRTTISTLSRQGVSFLPSERELSQLLGASRMTVRKALTEVEGAGLIRRSEKVRTEILVRRDPLAACGRILFIASGRHSNFDLPAMERLWTQLVPDVTRQGGDLELFLVNSDTPQDAWSNHVRGARVILTTTRGATGANGELLDEVASSVPVFSLLDTLPAPNSIRLDNLAVGRLAGEALVDAGCRRPVAIAPNYRNNGSTTYGRRIAGFSAALQEAGLLRPDMVRLISYPHPGRFRSDVGDRYIQESRELLEGAYREGCDGAFMTCDVDIGSIAMNLFREGAIPDRFRLVTVNGSGDSMRNYPLVSCVNHATAQVVETVLHQLQRIADNRFTGPVDLAIAPSLYANQTLGNDRNRS